MNQLWQMLASFQIRGEVMSTEELQDHFNLWIDDVKAALEVYKSQGLLDFIWLNEHQGEEYLYLTRAEGFETYKLLLPAITDDTLYSNWAKQIYPMLMSSFMQQITVPEAKEWRATCFPVYANAYYMWKSAALGEGIIVGIIRGLKSPAFPKTNTFLLLDDYEGPEFLPCVDVETLSK